MATKKPDTASKNGEKKPKPTISPRNGSDVTQHQFKKGKPGGPGRPPVRQLRDMLREEIPESEWLEMIYKTAQRAKKGDTAAMKLLAEYRDGKPQQSIDLTSNGETVPSLLVIERHSGTKSSDE